MPLSKPPLATRLPEPPPPLAAVVNRHVGPVVEVVQAYTAQVLGGSDSAASGNGGRRATIG